MHTQFLTHLHLGVIYSSQYAYLQFFLDSERKQENLEEAHMNTGNMQNLHTDIIASFKLNWGS